MYCIECGHQHSNAATFCQNCGCEISPPQPNPSTPVESSTKTAKQNPHDKLTSSLPSESPEAENSDVDEFFVQDFTGGTKVAEDSRDTGHIGVLSSISRYFVRHWNGELSLAKSFWINLIIISFLVMLFYYGLMATGAFSQVESALIFAKTYSMFTTFILSPWQMIGTWRAAKRTAMDTGKTLWPIIVMLSCCSLFLEPFNTIRGHE